jgi:hypothetical protein
MATKKFQSLIMQQPKHFDRCKLGNQKFSITVGLTTKISFWSPITMGVARVSQKDFLVSILTNTIK